MYFTLSNYYYFCNITSAISMCTIVPVHMEICFDFCIFENFKTVVNFVNFLNLKVVNFNKEKKFILKLLVLFGRRRQWK